MSKELNVKGLTKLTGSTTLVARIEKGDQTIADNIPLAESEDMEGYFSGDVPEGIEADTYGVVFMDSGTPGSNVIAIGTINWDGEKEVTEAVELQDVIIKNRNWNLV
ncbi:MAG: hypothetical protein AB8B61_00510 [Cyclobacteriaceae bacterium]